MAVSKDDTKSLEMAEFINKNSEELDSLINTEVFNDSDDVEPSIKSMKGKIKREIVIAFYTSGLFLPGFFNRNFFMLLGLVVPFIDFGTDYYNAGTDNKV